MTSDMNYEAIHLMRKQEIHKQTTSEHLNQWHDELMKRVVHLAIEKVEAEQGRIPAPFAFFVMGSAGRREQSIWSDQDHGIVFDGKKEHKRYFLRLGKEIVTGLELTGYQRCDGKVMASESMWTQTLASWSEQVIGWLEQASWQSLRHFSTFFDSRVLIGQKNLLAKVKVTTFCYLENHRQLYNRFIDNFDFIRKGTNIFGKLLTEQSGPMSGRVPIKTTTILPYVNAMRLLALHHQESRASTLQRMQELKTKYTFLQEYEAIYHQLMEFRFVHTKAAENYDAVHYIPLHQLSKDDKKELKQFMKSGSELFQLAKEAIETECSKW